MKKKIIYTIILCLGSLLAQAQTHNVFHLGHSLVSPYMPAMMQTFGDSSSGVNHSYEIGLINGAPLFWHWDNSSACQGYQASAIDSRAELASGNYDVFVMIEGSTWDNIIPQFYAYADSFHNAALVGNPSIQTYLYEGWNCLDTGTPLGCADDWSDSLTWVPRVRQDITTWEGVMDSLNAMHPTANPVYIIPAAQALANLSDSISANAVPGLTNFRNDLFHDDIHPNDIGFYFIACVHFATIYKRTPVGLPAQTFGEWGGPFLAPSAAMALKLQEIAWQTVCAYPNSGVACYPLSINESAGETKGTENKMEDILIYPNPSNGVIKISSKHILKEVEVFDLTGRAITKVLPRANSFELNLETGLYFLKASTKNKTRTKRVIIK